MCLDAPSAASTSTHEEVWTVKQQSIKTEIIATLQFASQHIPFSTADSLAMCYQQFPDSVIAKSMAVGPNEMSYVETNGWRSYFADMTIRKLMERQSYFTLYFHKMVNIQVKKQIDVLVRFWSETHTEVRVKYLTSVMLGHIRAEDFVKEMLGVLDRLAIPLRMMLSLGIDGPNVNKYIMHKINQVKKENDFQPLVKCPCSCPIHICHNSFRKVWLSIDTMLRNYA